MKYFPLISDILASQSPFLIRPLTLGILLSTPLIFVLRIVVVTNPIMSGIFYQHRQLFSLNLFISILLINVN